MGKKRGASTPPDSFKSQHPTMKESSWARKEEPAPHHGRARRARWWGCRLFKVMGSQRLRAVSWLLGWCWQLWCWDGVVGWSDAGLPGGGVLGWWWQFGCGLAWSEVRGRSASGAAGCWYSAGVRGLGEAAGGSERPLEASVWLLVLCCCSLHLAPLYVRGGGAGAWRSIY